ncbi:MAG: COX15/CtaA family protein [Rhodocyclales bacterium]|nr:COX15/CtaA family protein [Rhodocyclales bacterium]
MTTTNSQRAVAWWLFACCALVFLTMVVGGVTRLSHADWLELFAKYQQTPEFIKRNHDMTLEGFQFIFWWEWAHRLSGRLIGVVFFLPYVWFLVRGRLRGALAGKVFGFFILGGLQGAMGWYMVKSGLVDDPRVSQYRLAAHLGLAFLLFGLMYWTGLGMLQPRRAAGAMWQKSALATRRLGNWLVALVFIMVLSGALVAGIRAGLAYNTFPLMNGHFLPPEAFVVEPLWLNFFTNMATVQFDHRLIAWALMGLIPWFSWRIWTETPTARLPAAVLTLWLAVQVGLGIATLLLQVPVALGAAHQAGAMVLFGIVLWANHAIRRA